MNDQDEELQVPFLGRERKASIFDTKRTKWWSMWTFKVAITIILNFFCSILVFHIFQSVKPEHRPEELSYPTFPEVQKKFTSGLKYDEHGNLFLDDANKNKSYIGNSSDVNDAWKIFDAVQNIQLDRNKVNIQGLYIDRSNKVITIPDVFHQLHCLIRMALYDPRYLSVDDPKRHMHVDHCIDYVRQLIQCRADMTPLKVYYSDSAKRLMVDFEGFHTCRDFDATLAWAWENRVDHVIIQ